MNESAVDTDEDGDAVAGAARKTRRKERILPRYRWIRSTSSQVVRLCAREGDGKGDEEEEEKEETRNEDVVVRVVVIVVIVVVLASAHASGCVRARSEAVRRNDACRRLSHTEDSNRRYKGSAVKAVEEDKDEADADADADADANVRMIAGTMVLANTCVNA